MWEFTWRSARTAALHLTVTAGVPFLLGIIGGVVIMGVF